MYSHQNLDKNNTIVYNGYMHHLETPSMMPLDGVHPAANNTLRPGDVISGYQIKRRLGRGGSAEVMVAVHQETREPVAFKVSLDPEKNPFILNEIVAYNKVRGIGYVALMEGHGMLGDRAFIATRLQENGTMADIVRCDIDCDTPPQTDAAMCRRLRLFDNYATGISMAHSIAGVIHGDIKLNNLGVDLCETGRLFDFGLACKTDSPPQPNFIRGARGVNVPPEGYLGEISPASDVWALGAAAYHAFTLAAPFTTPPGESLLTHRKETLAGIDVKPRVLNPAIPTSVDDAITAALAPVPDDRPHIIELQSAFADAY